MGEASEAMRRLLFSDTAGGNKNKKMAHKINVARQYFSRVASLTGRFALSFGFYFRFGGGAQRKKNRPEKKNRPSPFIFSRRRKARKIKK